ncbi:MAG: glycine cleavage system protein GcvH [Candidatus Promineifilaceae bacterium]
MTQIVDGLYYTKEDEWLRVESDEGVIGITDYAQDSLSDIVYVELPDVDAELDAGQTFGVIESVKAAADLYVPVSGVVTAANESLLDGPEVINSDPYGQGWLIRVRLADLAELEKLMSADAYRAYCDSRA